jgi:hypothetical protein
MATSGMIAVVATRKAFSHFTLINILMIFSCPQNARRDRAGSPMMLPVYS